MTSGSQCTDLIERYLSTCDIPSLRDERGGAYFCVPNAHYRRLNVHLEISASFGDVLTIQVSSASSFPVADRPWLTCFADTWNLKNRGVTALLHTSPDPQRIGVVARRSQWIREDISFDAFASFVDRTVAAAIDLFAESAQVEMPSAAQSVLRDAG